MGSLDKENQDTHDKQPHFGDTVHDRGTQEVTKGVRGALAHAVRAQPGRASRDRRNRDHDESFAFPIDGEYTRMLPSTAQVLARQGITPPEGYSVSPGDVADDDAILADSASDDDGEVAF